MKERMEEAAESLMGVFSYRNQDALIKVTRNTLESIRKRITSSAMAVYIGGTYSNYKTKEQSSRNPKFYIRFLMF